MTGWTQRCLGTDLCCPDGSHFLPIFLQDGSCTDTVSWGPLETYARDRVQVVPLTRRHPCPVQVVSLQPHYWRPLSAMSVTVRSLQPGGCSVPRGQQRIGVLSKAVWGRFRAQPGGACIGAHHAAITFSHKQFLWNYG